MVKGDEMGSKWTKWAKWMLFLYRIVKWMLFLYQTVNWMLFLYQIVIRYDLASSESGSLTRRRLITTRELCLPTSSCAAGCVPCFQKEIQPPLARGRST